MIFFYQDQVWNPFHICKIQLQKKKSGVKMDGSYVHYGGGGGASDAYWKLNFHFVFLNPSLRDAPFWEEVHVYRHCPKSFWSSFKGFYVWFSWPSKMRQWDNQIIGPSYQVKQSILHCPSKLTNWSTKIELHILEFFSKGIDDERLKGILLSVL